MSRGARHGTTHSSEGVLGCRPSEAGLETEVGGRFPPGAVGGRQAFVSRPVALWPVALLQPPEARAAWKHSWTQASLSNACTQAGRQRPPTDREIQVSKEPSGFLATGAEVGQCPQLDAVSFPSSALRGKVTDPHSLGPGPHPGVASTPHRRGEHASFIPEETEAAGGHLYGPPHPAREW